MNKNTNRLHQHDWDVAIFSVTPLTELRALLRVFGKNINDEPDFSDKGQRFWKISIYNELKKRNLKAVVTAFGDQGNYVSSSVVSRILESIEPQAAFLCGIAAGYKEKVKFGDVVISTNVIGYEPIRLQSPPLKRPNFQTSTFEMKQNLWYFDIGQTHFKEYFLNSQRQLNPNEKPMNLETSGDVKSNIHINDIIASGEKLIADDSITKLREDFHEKIRAAEMEAIGFAVACNNRTPQVPFAIFRGISDYGDNSKTDQWQATASNAAAAALRAFLESCYDPPHHNKEEKNQIIQHENDPQMPIVIKFELVF